MKMRPIYLRLSTAEGGEKHDDAAVSAAANALPTQTRKRGIDAVRESKLGRSRVSEDGDG